MDKADRGVSQPNETSVERGKLAGKFCMITTPPWLGCILHRQETLFLMTTRFGHGFAFSQRIFHKLQSKAEVVTESCEGEGCSVFLLGNTAYLGWTHPHLTFVKSGCGRISGETTGTTKSS